MDVNVESLDVNVTAQMSTEKPGRQHRYTSQQKKFSSSNAHLLIVRGLVLVVGWHCPKTGQWVGLRIRVLAIYSRYTYHLCSNVWYIECSR